MLIGTPYDPNNPSAIEADVWGVLTVINDIYDHKDPTLFGTPEIREALKKELVPTSLAKLNSSEFYQFFAERLAHYGLTPFKDISLATVACRNNKDFASTIACMEPVLEQFAHCYDISSTHANDFAKAGKAELVEDAPHHNALLNHKNALEYTGGKRVDYVMTGNVVNAPDNPDKLSTILACANMLREGGVAVHMVGYGEQRTAGSVIGMKVLPAFLQQSHDKIVPEGAFEPWQLPQRTRMMVFTQQHEIHYGAPEYEFFKQFRLNKERADMVVATSDGSTQFRLGDYFDYFLTHPERLTTMPPLTTMSLGVMPLLEDLQQGKEWSTYAAYTLAQDSGFASKVKPPVPEIEKMKWPQTCEIIQSYLDWRDEAIVTVAAELARDKTPQVQVSSVTHAAPAQSASLNL